MFSYFQGLKVCANHAITADLKFSEVKATKNTWMWSSIDFTDDEKGKLEKFEARFETEEESGEFRKVLKEVQSSQQPPVQMVFENQSASKVRSWSCVSCYVNNHVEAVKCIACDTAKPVPATKEVVDKEKEARMKRRIKIRASIHLRENRTLTMNPTGMLRCSPLRTQIRRPLEQG